MGSELASEGARVRECQQASVARLGLHALAGADPDELMSEGARAAAEELGADYSKVLELLPEGDRLLMRAGVGWEASFYGSATVEGGALSQAGYTLLSHEPVILVDSSSETRFSLASLHKNYRITSGVTVVIPGKVRPFGILGAYTSERRTFSEDDVNFLQSIANVLAAAIEGKRAGEERERLLEEMRQMAEVSQRRAAELQGILSNMLDAVFVTDTDSRVVMVNPAGVHMLGLAERHRMPWPLSSLRIRRTDGRPFGEDHPLRRALERESVALEDVIIEGMDGKPDLPVRINAAPIRGDAGKVVGAVMVARDLTSVIELEKLKDQFISMAAHELKTPVAVMKGYSQALLRAEGTPLGARKMLDAIDRGSDRIDMIVRDLLDISRFHAGKLELVLAPVEFTRLARHVADKFAVTAPRHQVVVRTDGEVVVRADPERVEQVLLNLVDNAVKYSPAGGEAEIRVEKAGDEAVVSVTDQGVGIPLVKQAGVFERFYRAHAGTRHDYGGMGVGLYISREIVERHGGRIWFESQDREGSAFHFSLPLAREDLAQG